MSTFIVLLLRHMVNFEIFAKSMTPCLSRVKVTPSFCFPNTIPDNLTATNIYIYFQVCQWLLALGMESYITLFMDKTITGAALLNLDSSGLKDLGIKNKDDREKIKKKIKELKAHNDREKKDMEKEKNKREKLLKKAEKVIHVGKGKK